MGVLTQYAGRNGFTVTKWSGPTQAEVNRSNANLGVAYDSFRPEATMNGRYSESFDWAHLACLPFNAKGFISGAMQHGDAFSLPAQKGDIVYDLWMGGYLDDPEQGPVTNRSPAEINQQDVEDCHFLFDAAGMSLWSSLKSLHAAFFGEPVPTPQGPPAPPPTPPPAVGAPLSPVADRVEELRAALLGQVLRNMPLAVLLSSPAWLVFTKPVAVELLKTYRRLRRHLGDPRPLPEGE